MDQEKKLSDQILDLGEDFQVDAMEDYEDRVNSGEFADKSDAEIRAIYFEEALVDEEDDEMREHFRAMDEQEEAEEDGIDFHVPVDVEDSDEEDEDSDEEDEDSDDELFD